MVLHWKYCAESSSSSSFRNVIESNFLFFFFSNKFNSAISVNKEINDHQCQNISKIHNCFDVWWFKSYRIFSKNKTKKKKKKFILFFFLPVCVLVCRISKEKKCYNQIFIVKKTCIEMKDSSRQDRSNSKTSKWWLSSNIYTRSWYIKQNKKKSWHLIWMTWTTIVRLLNLLRANHCWSDNKNLIKKRHIYNDNNDDDANRNRQNVNIEKKRREIERQNR